MRFTIENKNCLIISNYYGFLKLMIKPLNMQTVKAALVKKESFFFHTFLV